MPNKKLEDYADNEIISSEEAEAIMAEWHKDPEFVREYEAFKKEFAEMQRQDRVKDARRQAQRAWFATLVARVRDFWYSLAGGLDRVA